MGIVLPLQPEIVAYSVNTAPAAIFRQNFTAAISSWDAEVKDVEMHDEIFHFEIFKNFMKIFEIFQDPFFEIFHETFNFQY